MKRYIILLTSVVLFWSCGLKAFEHIPEDEIPESPAIQEESSLFVQDEGADCYVFETNETKYISETGYTLWTSNYVNESVGFQEFSARVCKLSGNKEAGYGIVFCAQKIEGKPFLLTVLINTSGSYSVGKVTDGVFSYILTSKTAYSLNSGYGVYNTISVSHDNEKREFVLKFNDVQTDRFSISEDLVFKDSRAGFVTVISDSDDFPENPVKVTFEKL